MAGHGRECWEAEQGARATLRKGLSGGRHEEGRKGTGENQLNPGKRQAELVGGARDAGEPFSFSGTQSQGNGETHDQQEHGDRQEHCDDYHAARPGHS